MNDFIQYAIVTVVVVLAIAYAVKLFRNSRKDTGCAGCELRDHCSKSRRDASC